MQLTVIKSINMSNNSIATVADVDWSKLSAIETLDLTSNACIANLPPAVIRDTSCVVQYLQELQQGQLSCRRSRMMFVGDSNVGKSSLRDALQSKGGKETPLPTFGIEISDMQARHLSTCPPL